jgi:hypothetical protein
VRIERRSDIQNMSYVKRVTHRTDPDFDLLRARVWERSARVAWRQRIQEIVLSVMAVVLGSVTGWAVMR